MEVSSHHQLTPPPEHGAMTAEQVERWRAEEMKRQQLAAMHGYPSPYPPSMHPPVPTLQPPKHALETSKEEGVGGLRVSVARRCGWSTAASVLILHEDAVTVKV